MIYVLQLTGLVALAGTRYAKNSDTRWACWAMVALAATVSLLDWDSW